MIARRMMSSVIAKRPITHLLGLSQRSLLRRGKPVIPRRTLFEQTVETQNQYRSNRRLNKWVLSLVGLVTVGYGIWWAYCPHNPFQNSVATILRKGLWAESDKEEFNYKKALTYYIKALDECNKLKLDNISDEYTGIELKIAEMYEKTKEYDNANSIYLELLYRFYDALIKPGSVSEERRPEIIRRDLRVLIKSLETNKDISIGKRNLLAHLLLVQQEILTRSPDLRKFFDDRKAKPISLFQAKSSEASDFKTFANNENIKLDNEGYMILDLQKDSSAWEPFKEEFFTARDLYTAYCLSAKDLKSALSCKMTTVEWMVMADMPPGQILLSQANLGSLLYLQSEKFESDIYQLNSKCDEKIELKNDENTIRALRNLNRNKDTCMKMATQCYDSVIQFAKKNNKLRFNAKDQLDPSAAQAIALSVYGMGVLNLHQGILAKAERLLKDSVDMAKEIDFSELIKEAENELEKVDKAKTERLSR